MAERVNGTDYQPLKANLVPDSRGLVPAIHVASGLTRASINLLTGWIAGSSPAKTLCGR
jgi:hypothetical protein